MIFVILIEFNENLKNIFKMDKTNGGILGNT